MSVTNSFITTNRYMIPVKKRRNCPTIFPVRIAATSTPIPEPINFTINKAAIEMVTSVNFMENKMS